MVGQATLFYLKGTNVLASLNPWNGDIEPIDELEEVWVQVKGIPPKWAHWWTIKDVATSLGLLMEIDWTVLFSSFFATARIKIKCKKPAYILKERVCEMGGACYLVYFKTEGVTQVDEPPEEDDGKGEDEDPEDDDLLEDELKELEKEKENNNKGAGGSQNKDNFGKKDSGQKNPEISAANSQKNNNSVRRALDFQSENKIFSLDHSSYVNLLNAMELEGSEVGDSIS